MSESKDVSAEEPQSSKTDDLQSSQTQKQSDENFIQKLRTTLTDVQSILFLVNGGLLALNVTMLTSALHKPSAATLFWYSSIIAFASFYTIALGLIMAAVEKADLKPFPLLARSRKAAADNGKYKKLLDLRLKTARSTLSALIFVGPVASGALFIAGLLEHADAAKAKLVAEQNRTNSMTTQTEPCKRPLPSLVWLSAHDPT